MKKHDLAVVACSFGMDSMVVLHMVKTVCEELGKPYKIIWNNTGVEYPEQYRFNKRIIKEWNLEDKLIVAKSEDWTFWDISQQYGMPIVPRDSRNEEMRMATQACCYYLKKAPTKKALKQFKGVDYVYFTGLTAEESYNRRSSAKRYGDYFYSTSWSHWKCHPILWYNKEQILKYIEDNNIPMCDIYSYDEIPNYKIRNGCWTCPQAWKFGKGKWMKRYYPKLYKYLITKTELGEYIMKKKLGYIDSNGKDDMPKEFEIQGMVQNMFEHRPCFFDKL